MADALTALVSALLGGLLAGAGALLAVRAEARAARSTAQEERSVQAALRLAVPLVRLRLAVERVHADALHGLADRFAELDESFQTDSLALRDARLRSMLLDVVELARRFTGSRYDRVSNDWVFLEEPLGAALEYMQYALRRHALGQHYQDWALMPWADSNRMARWRPPDRAPESLD